jgi:integrase
MPHAKLTERAIAKLPAPTPTGKQIAYWDVDLRGFGVLCSGRTNSKSFVAQRDLQNGKTRRVTIAHVNEISLAEAKDRARKLLVEMRGGKDPKAKPKTSGTLQETAELYLQSARLSARSKEIYERLIRIHLATLKDRPLSSITPQEIDALHNNITGKSVANAAIRCFRLLFNWAARRDDSLGRTCRLSKNEWHAVTPRRNPIPPEKLDAFYKAVQALPSMPRDYVCLLLFTGLRRREASALLWKEVDFERRLISFQRRGRRHASR